MFSLFGPDPSKNDDAVGSKVGTSADAWYEFVVTVDTTTGAIKICIGDTTITVPPDKVARLKAQIDKAVDMSLLARSPEHPTVG